jgi:hypothetical protein
MTDWSTSNLGTNLFGDASQLNPSGSILSSFPGGSAGALGAGALGVGALGLGATLAMGESPLPPEFSQLTASVPTLQAEGSQLYGEGQTLTGQGTAALAMAQAGQLTPEQQAQLTQFQQKEQNQAIQTYAGMGRNFNQDTSAISTQAAIDTNVNAMAQQQIQSTIALGLGEIQAGGSFSSTGLAYDQAANSALIAAGQAQVQQDTAYRQSLSSAFSAIGTMFGSIGGAAIKALV